MIVAGETGSGKTTQLPKICLELGRGVRGLIGHTQPRRLAARTVAERIAEELGTELGDAVGYKVRFTDQVGDGTLVKLMTDGILLAEMQRDRMLRQYDTLIIDEAHERSLNIDFILGYLKQLLPRRPDLKVIITSATIDPERFARHFGDPTAAGAGRRGVRADLPGRGALPAAGRGRRGRGRGRGDEENVRDQIQAIGDAVEELAAEGPGDILVFLCGEREIRDTADALGKLVQRSRRCAAPRSCRCTPGCPPPSSTGSSQPHAGRRVVLATNVAETSLTVPGIRYVVDPGTARISRYSHRLKVQRLPIEPVSQASANQRKGRCGRASDGICIRLYDEEDFARPAGVHRPGDPAHQPRLGHPADDRARARRHRRVPVRRPAGPAQRQRRRRPAAGARRARPGRDRPGASGSPRSAAGWPSCRSTRGWAGWCWRPSATAAPPRCW